MGYLSHGLLDACTTYGTQLLWPFSDDRVAWNVISIVDPLFTLPLLAAVALGVRAKRVNAWPRVGLIWLFAYLGIGEIQRQRAETVGYEVAEARGHAPTRLEAKPGFAQLLLWKIVYEYEGQFFVDGVRAGIQTKVYPGTHIPKLDSQWAEANLPINSQTRQDFERFRWFSNDYLALSLHKPNTIIDIRYSMNINEIAPLWSIQFDPSKPWAHVDYLTHRNLGPSTTAQFQTMLMGQ